MKLAFGTDWHLDHLKRGAAIDFIDSLNSIEGDVIVVSGDIAEADTIEHYLVQISGMVDKPFYFVLGNHDFYRSSYHEVREKVRTIASYLTDVHWLESRVIQLKNKVAMFGCDGWYDGEFGSYYSSKLQLLDFDLIKDFKHKNVMEVRNTMSVFADIAARQVRRVLPELLEKNDLVVFVTHVPPFKELCYYAGKPTNNDALPFFSSKLMGNALVDVAKEYPDKEVLVLCGHTHHEANFKIGNINCVCGSARYGTPTIFTTINLK